MNNFYSNRYGNLNTASGSGSGLPSLFFFIVAFVIVFLFVYAILAGYRVWTRGTEQDIDIIEKENTEGIPITDPRLMKLSAPRLYYLAKIHLVKLAENQYKLVIEYNWNNITRSLDLYRQDLILQEQLRRSDRNAQTAFDQIVDKLDNSTARSGDILDWKYDPTMQQVSDSTEEALGFTADEQLTQAKNIMAIQAMVPQVTQKDLNDMFAFLDMLRMDLELKSVIDLEFQNREMKLSLPVRLVGRSKDGVLLRFDPQTLVGLGAGMGDQVRSLFRTIDIWVFDDKFIMYPKDMRDRMISISLI